MNDRKIFCKKLGRELSALAKPPFAGEIGEKIFANISADAWGMWKNDMQLKVINEYRLNMSVPKDYQTLIDQMLAFLNLSDQKVAEVENAQRGRQS